MQVPITICKMAAGVQSSPFAFSMQAVTHYNDPKKLAEVSTGLGEAMVGIDCRASNFYSYAARSE